MKHKLFLLLLFSASSHANLWLESSDLQDKQDLQFLSARGVINLPTSSFPIPWQGIVRELKATTDLNAAEQDAVARLLASYAKNANLEVTASISNETFRLPATPNHSSETAGLKVGKSFSNDYVSARIDADLVSGELAGSYLASQIGNWLVYYSTVEQFWGPGNDTSLIYSDYIKPIPTLGIQRADSKAVDLPVLNWLGSWTAQAQFSRLESNRAVADTMLWSARVAFRPINQLELGFSHVAQWGGEGNDSSLSGFIDMISGEETCADGTTNCPIDSQSRLGNQLAAIDAKFNYNIDDASVSLYAQLVGEDAPVSGIVPADKIFMYGASLFKPLAKGFIKVYVESIDSNLSCSSSNNIQNCLYEHHTYASGYRYKGLPIGSAYDNDSTSHVLGAVYSSPKHVIETKVKWLALNEDDSNRSLVDGFGGHYLTANNTDLTVLEYRHQYLYSAQSEIELVLQSKISGELDDDENTIVKLQYKHNF